MDTADRIMGDILAVMRGAAPAPIDPRVHQSLRNLMACYRKAQKEPLARIPSYLEAAIQNVEALLPKSANVYGERREAPRYQERRDGGTDMSPRGGPLEPGS